MKSAHLKTLSAQNFGYATYPEVWLHESPDENAGKVVHLLFGDYISPPRGANGELEKWKGDNITVVDGVEWIFARSRKKQGWIKAEDIESDAILEVNFVDVGQGDGCHIVTPSDEQIVIDAGVSDNMFRFLKWRFNLENPGVDPPPFTAIISHPDKDHFYGFKNLFHMPEKLPRKLVFEEIYHNGLVQRKDSFIGESVRDDAHEYRSVVETDREITKLLREGVEKSQYESILLSAKEANPGVKINMLYREDRKTPNYFYKNEGLTIEVLGPIPETVKKQKVLRWLDDTGKTKNGHSVILKLTIGKLSMLLGGDLNTLAADYLLSHYSGADIATLREGVRSAKTGRELEKYKNQLDEAILKCRKFFQCHIAKACHHGSHDIPNEFLKAVNPIATIISSGDEEAHCHPRPETLGAVGKFGRGERPLIYSTELSRSSPEYIELKKDDYPNAKIKERIVVTYGMINVRTDGERVIIAQKLERKRQHKEWQIEKLVWSNVLKDFEYDSKK